MFRLDKKVAIVTGAARGMGAATAIMLANQGAKVALVDVDGETMKGVTEEIGSNAKSYVVDISDVNKINKLIESVEQDLGRIDILVNNAGICPRLPFADSTEKDWQVLFDVNAKSQYFLCQAVWPIMKKQGGGRIVNICSSAGRIGGLIDASIYSGTKGAIAMFTKSIAREVVTDGILVNAVSPGEIETDMYRQLSKEQKEELCKKIPLGRPGTPQEVAAVTTFLVSDECSYCTGAMFDVAGGMVML